MYRVESGISGLKSEAFITLAVSRQGIQARGLTCAGIEKKLTGVFEH